MSLNSFFVTRGEKMSSLVLLMTLPEYDLSDSLRSSKLHFCHPVVCLVQYLI